VLLESRYLAHLFGAPLKRRCTVLISHKVRVTALPRAMRTTLCARSYWQECERSR
jgi:hypothetical protein